MMIPPEVGGGRHGYGQSGVSANDDVAAASAVIREKRTVAGRPEVDMASSVRVPACEIGRAHV